VGPPRWPPTRRSPPSPPSTAPTPSQVALAWLLALYDGLLLIPGTGSVAHLEENMAAAELELDAEDMAALEGVEQLGDPMARVERG
jgi:aryl-alcohol dehydrogenase-like predicted oxidoreductase